MKNLYLLLCMSFVAFNAGAQITKIAILDFENVSGNPKYSGLGKAV